MPPPDPSLASNRHRRSRIVGAVAEGAAAFPLAAEAAASMDLGGRPTCRHRQISAAAAGRALARALCLCHVFLPMSESFPKTDKKLACTPLGGQLSHGQSNALPGPSNGLLLSKGR
jgi:hypothetical protein